MNEILVMTQVMMLCATEYSKEIADLEREAIRIVTPTTWKDLLGYLSVGAPRMVLKMALEMTMMIRMKRWHYLMHPSRETVISVERKVIRPTSFLVR